LDPDAEDADLQRVLLIVAPGRASDNLRGTVVNALGDAQAAGVSAAEISAALPGAGPGKPWERIAAAADVVLRERRAAQAAEAAQTARLPTALPPPPPLPPSPRLVTLAERINHLGVRQIQGRLKSNTVARVLEADCAKGIRIKYNVVIAGEGPLRQEKETVLRTEYQLGQWNFGPAESVDPARAAAEGAP
jgi:hypothetical protein